MFKKGDIVSYYYGKSVVKLLSDPVWDYYYTLGGWKSSEKSWHCKALHLEGIYEGQRVSVFHVKECELVLPFNMERKIKKHVL
jgi:hypothetical protein